MKSVEIDVLAPDIGADAEQIPLVGHGVEQLVMVEKPGEGRVAGAFRTPRLDRESEMASVAEAECQENVRDRIPRPV
jgi:hypothetical protein